MILPCPIGKFYVIVKNNNTVSPAGKYPVVINPVAGHGRQQVGKISRYRQKAETQVACENVFSYRDKQLGEGILQKFPPQDTLVAQLDRAFDYESKGRGFESFPVYQFTTRQSVQRSGHAIMFGYFESAMDRRFTTSIPNTRRLLLS